VSLNKKFRLSANDMKPLATGRGSCYASDYITVEGCKVGYMYREDPGSSTGNVTDSGWRFFSGQESQEYVDNPANLAIYDVNTIANYDPGIIKHLSAEFGKAFARAENGEFIEERASTEEDI
jgi:hypothetical protein